MGRKEFAAKISIKGNKRFGEKMFRIPCHAPVAHVFELSHRNFPLDT
jgi:hypothetical protein